MSVHKKILIADTSAATKALIAQMLENYGYQVDTYSKESDACKALKEHNYSLVISSEKFLKLHGLSKSKNSEIPFYMTSTMLPEKLHAKCILKPLKLEKVEQMLLGDLHSYQNAA